MVRGRGRERGKEEGRESKRQGDRGRRGRETKGGRGRYKVTEVTAKSEYYLFNQG